MKRQQVLAMMLGAVALSTTAACGSSVRSKVIDAMSGCVQARNALFKSGKADVALATPLPAAIDSLADETAYRFGFLVYQEAANAAETQAELTCALELGAHYEHADVRTWLKYFFASPDAPVSQHARRLYEQQLVRIGRAVPATP
jgi:hypothetical protein